VQNAGSETGWPSEAERLGEPRPRQHRGASHCTATALPLHYQHPRTNPEVAGSTLNRQGRSEAQRERDQTIAKFSDERNT